MNKIKFAVVEGTMLCYVRPEMPNLGFILGRSHNAPSHFLNGSYPLGKDVRPATLNDFERFRVEAKGYMNDPMCEMPNG